MGACVAKPKTVGGKAFEEATTISTPKVAPEPTISIEVAANEQIVEKVVEEAKEEPAAAATIIELPNADIKPERKVEVTPEVITKPEQTKEEILEKIIEEEKPSTLNEEKIVATKVMEETSEVIKKDFEEEKPTQS